MELKNSYNLRERMQNKVNSDEIGIIMGEGGFKPKRELFMAKLGVIVNKDGWEDDTQVLLKEMVTARVATGEFLLIPKSDINIELEMDLEKPLDSWIYEINFILGCSIMKDGNRGYIANIMNNRITTYDIKFDPEIFATVSNVVRMWCEDIDKAKAIQFKIAQLQKKSVREPHLGNEITKLKLELESFYDEGEGTDDYYKFLVKKKYVRNLSKKWRDMQSSRQCDDTEMMYVKRCVELEESIKYLEQRKAKTKYWLMNYMRSNGIDFLRTEGGNGIGGKNAFKGIYFLNGKDGFDVDFRRVGYRPNMRALKNKLDQAFE